MPRRRHLRDVSGFGQAVAPLLALLLLAVFAASAHATFPGENGRVAYAWSVGGEAFEEGRAPRLVGVVSVRPDGRPLPR